MDDDFSDLPNQLLVTLRQEFNAVRILNSRLNPVNFEIKIDLFNRDDESDDYQNRMEIAIAKIEYWFKVINRSIIFSIENEWAATRFLTEYDYSSENNIILCPDMPLDSVLCELFLCKIKALVGDVFLISTIEIKASDARGLTFLFMGSDPGSDFPNATDWLGEHNYFNKPWWNRDDASSLDLYVDETIDLTQIPLWAHSMSHVVDSIRNPTANVSKIVRAEFRPTVIKGGKED